jgi:hypothetical protein
MTQMAALVDWLKRYEAAWRSLDPGQIGDLFAPDAVYRWHPWDGDGDAAIGRQTIVEAWLEKQDPPDSWRFQAEAVAIQDDLGIARCITTYLGKDRRPRATYHNVFFVRLNDDGQCYDFVEYYMEAPGQAGSVSMPD